MTVKDQLLTTALLGTEHQPLPELRCDGQLGTYLENLQVQSTNLNREQCVLHAAALVHVHSRAEMILDKFDGELPPVAPDDDMPPIPLKACSHLIAMIEYNNELIDEWLEMVVAQGRRIRNEYLVQALVVGTQMPVLQGLLKATVGRRGAWLAQFNKEWKYVTDESQLPTWGYIEDKWSTGSQEKRELVLRAARKLDRERGLALLIATWKEESTETRTAFLKCLEGEVSIVDESFLEETALNDKRKEVRTEALELLHLIPESRYRQRARTRAFAALNLVSAPPAKGIAALNPFRADEKTFEVNIPETADKEMIRDGIVAKSNDTRLGEKAFILRQLVAAVDPSEWCQRFGISYDNLIVAAQKSDWRLAILLGLEAASIAFSNEATAKAHLLIGSCEDPSGLAATLSNTERENVLTILFEANKFLPPSPRQQGDYLTLRAVLESTERWSLTFSKTVVQVQRNYLKPRSPDFFNIDYFINATAWRLDTSLIPEINSIYTEQGAGIPLIEKALETLFFRKEMKDALTVE